MTEQELLEKLTGVNNPRFITPREDAIIKECLTIINNLEQQLTIPVVSNSSIVLHNCSCDKPDPVEVKMCLECDGITHQ